MSAIDDIDLLRNQQSRASDSIDWDRIITINYRSYIQPDAVVVDVGAGEGLQSRRLRRFAQPSQLFLVEPDAKAAAKLRFQWGRKRGITVVQVALGAETVQGDDFDIDRLDDWTLPAPLSFLRIAAGSESRAVLDGAGTVLDRDRPTIGFESDANPDALAQIAIRHNLTVLDLLGNVVSPEHTSEILAYQPAVVLLPHEQLEGRKQHQATLRADVLRSITTSRPSRERLKRWLGV